MLNKIRKKEGNDHWKNVVLVPSLYPKDSSQSHWDRVLAPMYTNMKPSRAERFRQMKNSRRRMELNTSEQVHPLPRQGLSGIARAVPIRLDRGGARVKSAGQNRAHLDSLGQVSTESSLLQPSPPVSSVTGSSPAGPGLIQPGFVGPILAGTHYTIPNHGKVSPPGPSRAGPSHGGPVSATPSDAEPVHVTSDHVGVTAHVKVSRKASNEPGQ